MPRDPVPFQTAKLAPVSGNLCTWQRNGGEAANARGLPGGARQCYGNACVFAVIAIAARAILSTKSTG